MVKFSSNTFEFLCFFNNLRAAVIPFPHGCRIMYCCKITTVFEYIEGILQISAMNARFLCIAVLSIV